MINLQTYTHIKKPERKNSGFFVFIIIIFRAILFYCLFLKTFQV